MKKNNKSKPLIVIQCYEDRQKTLSLRKIEHTPSELTTNDHLQQKRDATDSPPPPPPPMPFTNGQQNGEHKKVDNQKPTTKAINIDLNKISNLRNGTLTRTPTPDYHNKIESSAHSKLKDIKDEKAELESLESYKLKNSANIPHKPPSNYFVRAPNGTATMKKHVRPVSVTIGEYNSSGGNRREPSKLDFLNGDKLDGSQVADDVPITNRLQSELALTLSRSNLRKKTETLGQSTGKNNNLIKDMNSKEDSDSSIDKNFHTRYD